jgi:phage gp36-like protein
MAYADQTVLEDAYGADEIRQLADRDGIGIASPEVLARMQAQADDLIDRHLASAGYAVPVADPVPPTIIACSSAIQRYFLFDDGRPESVIDDFKYWMRWLEQVAAGKVLLQLPAADVSAVGSPDYAAPDRVFSADTLVDY